MAPPVAISKLLESPYSHIKGNSVLKVCWADMPYVCWGEHCIWYMVSLYYAAAHLQCRFGSYYIDRGFSYRWTCFELGCVKVQGFTVALRLSCLI